MKDRRETLLWIKDLIEHMNRCHEQLQWNAEGPGARFLTEALLVDLGECRKLCEELRRPRPCHGGLLNALRVVRLRPMIES